MMLTPVPMAILESKASKFTRMVDIQKHIKGAKSFYIAQQLVIS